LILISCGNGVRSTKYQEGSIKTANRGPIPAESKLPQIDLNQQSIKVGANRTENY